MTRQIVLDTETTGLSAENGDRVIELGCVELFNRKLTGNDLHIYFNPERESHEDALKVHGLTTDFLRDKPKFATLAQRHRRVPARCRTDHSQRRLRRRLPQQGTRACRPAAAAQLRRRGHRHAGDGEGGVPRQAQLAGRAVRPLRRRSLEPHLPRRQARRAAAGRRLHQPHARPGCAADRRRVERADHGRGGARSICAASSCRCWWRPSTNSPRTRKCWRNSTRPATARRFSGRSSRTLWHNRRLRATRRENPSRRTMRRGAVSSGVEHSIHTAGVGGSKPPPPTNFLFPCLVRVGWADANCGCAPVVARRKACRTLGKGEATMATSPDLPTPITSDPPDVPDCRSSPMKGPPRRRAVPRTPKIRSPSSRSEPGRRAISSPDG